jgi:hypothetical protein
MVVSSAHAQGQQMSPDMQNALSQALGKMFQQAVTNMVKHRVRVTPAITEIDPKVKTATLEFFNASDDTVNAALSIGTVPPTMMGGQAAQAPQNSANPLLADTGSAKATAPDSVASEWSLASWVQDLPAHIQLAPNEKKSVTVHLDIPASVKPGDYAAWIVATTEVSGQMKVKSTSSESGNMRVKGGSISLNMQGNGGKALSLQGGAKLVYHAK